MIARSQYSQRLRCVCQHLVPHSPKEPLMPSREYVFVTRYICCTYKVHTAEWHKSFLSHLGHLKWVTFPKFLNDVFHSNHVIGMNSMQTCNSVTFYFMKNSFSDVSRKWIVPNMIRAVLAYFIFGKIHLLTGGELT